MGRTLRRCNLTVTQNNNSIKGRIMAKATVKNLMFLNQEQEIRTVRPKQRLKGRAGLQQGVRYHCPWGMLATVGIAASGCGHREDERTLVAPQPGQQLPSSMAAEPGGGKGTTVHEASNVPHPSGQDLVP